jgi:hypothetical protein
VSFDAVPVPALNGPILQTSDVPCPDDSIPSLAVAPGARVVAARANQAEFEIITPEGSSSVPLVGEVPFNIVVGPRDVVYGIINVGTAAVPPSGLIVAIPLGGPNAGTVVKSQPVDLNVFVEAPPGMLAISERGVVDRRNDQLLITLVDQVGADLPPGEAPQLQRFAIDEEQKVTSLSGSTSWQLTIQRDPRFVLTEFATLPPIQIDRDRVIYSTFLGPPSSPSNTYLDPTLGVMVLLQPDGNGEWVSLPDGWRVLAAGPNGAVIGPLIGCPLTFAFVK